MKRSGTLAAIALSYSIATIAVVFAIYALTSPRSDYLSYEEQGYKSERDYCDAKLRSFGYTENKTTANSTTPNEDPQKRRDDLCLSIRSAEAAEWATEYARRQLAWAQGGIILAFVAAVAAALAAAFTRSQSEIAHQSLVASNRAWLRIDDIKLAGSLRYDRMGIEAPFAFFIKNCGTAPALDIEFDVWLLPVDNGKIPIEEAKRLCNNARHRRMRMGITLFPEQTVPGNAGQPGTTARVEPDRIAAVTQGDPTGRITLHVVGCVTYSFASDPTKRYQSCVIRELKTNNLTPVFCRRESSIWRTD